MIARGRIPLVTFFAVFILAFSRLAIPGTPADNRSYDVVHYDLNLSLFPESMTIAGYNLITLTATAAITELRLDAGSTALRVDSVTTGGRKLAYRHSGDVLEIVLPSTLRPSETLSLTVHYRGRSAFDGRYDSGGILFTRTGIGYSVGTISQPNFARHWWPCNDRPSDKALVTLRCSVPAGMTVVSNGRLVSKTERRLTHTFEWATKTPIATYLVFLGASDYLVSRDTLRLGDGRTLDLALYLFPEDSAKGAEDFRNVKEILAYFSTAFAPYPFADEQFAVAEVEGRLTMENQTVVAMERGLITGDRSNENTFVHEIAHQWWGNLVTPSDWHHTWLSEGFATYSEALYIESRRGPAVYREYIDHLMDQPPGAYAGSVIGRNENAFWDSFGPAVYYKGAIALHMLRRMMGDSVFFACLRAYAADPRFAYGNASTDDFRSVAEAHHGSHLGWFFDQWIHADRGNADRPTLTYEWVAGQDESGYTLSLSIVQLPGAADPWKLPFTVRILAGGESWEYAVVDSLPRQEFVFRTPAPADSVLLDPERDLFMHLQRGLPD